MTDEQIEQAKDLAEDLKGKEGVGNPHALARQMVKRGR